LFAFGLESMLHHVSERLAIVPAVALCGGTALYMLGPVAFLYRATGYLFRRRTIGAVALLALVPVAVTIPALAALGLVSLVRTFVVGYEAIAHRADRTRVRHPER
jgi:low temperature requirement protein LtrA